MSFRSRPRKAAPASRLAVGPSSLVQYLPNAPMGPGSANALMKMREIKEEVGVALGEIVSDYFDLIESLPDSTSIFIASEKSDSETGYYEISSVTKMTKVTKKSAK